MTSPVADACKGNKTPRRTTGCKPRGSGVRPRTDGIGVQPPFGQESANANHDRIHRTRCAPSARQYRRAELQQAARTGPVPCPSRSALGGPWPVVVIDDGSAAPLGDVCAPYDQVKLVRQDNAGPAAARNRGAAEADGSRLLLFIDDDCEPHADWARTLVAAQADVAGRLVGGQVVNALPDNVFPPPARRCVRSCTISTSRPTAR